MKNKMDNFLLGTSDKWTIGAFIFTFAVLCVGYIIHRKRTGPIVGGGVNVLEELQLNHIFDWIDIVVPSIENARGEKLKVCILPNKESQQLAKTKDTRIYVVTLQKDIEGSSKVLKTKIFYANSVSKDLSSLDNGNIVEIPIK